jgi:hypothetical protein
MPKDLVSYHFSDEEQLQLHESIDRMQQTMAMAQSSESSDLAIVACSRFSSTASLVEFLKGFVDHSPGGGASKDQIEFYKNSFHFKSRLFLEVSGLLNSDIAQMDLFNLSLLCANKPRPSAAFFVLSYDEIMVDRESAFSRLNSFVKKLYGTSFNNEGFLFNPLNFAVIIQDIPSCQYYKSNQSIRVNFLKRLEILKNEDKKSRMSQSHMKIYDFLCGEDGKRLNFLKGKDLILGSLNLFDHDKIEMALESQASIEWNISQYMTDEKIGMAYEPVIKEFIVKCKPVLASIEQCMSQMDETRGKLKSHINKIIEKDENKLPQSSLFLSTKTSSQFDEAKRQEIKAMKDEVNLRLNSERGLISSEINKELMLLKDKLKEIDQVELKLSKLLSVRVANQGSTSSEYLRYHEQNKAMINSSPDLKKKIIYLENEKLRILEECVNRYADEKRKKENDIQLKWSKKEGADFAHLKEPKHKEARVTEFNAELNFYEIILGQLQKLLETYLQQPCFSNSKVTLFNMINIMANFSSFLKTKFALTELSEVFESATDMKLKEIDLIKYFDESRAYLEEIKEAPSYQTEKKITISAR